MSLDIRSNPTKAEMLSILKKKDVLVPNFFYFNVKEWKEKKSEILKKIKSKFKSGSTFAVRSSSLIEDGKKQSYAGKYKTFLNVKMHKVEKCINTVIKSYDNNPGNQIIIQKMAKNISMSGVCMSRNIEDGAPYYVLNYDDTSGRTDTVTGGKGQSKLVYIFRDFHNKFFDSVRLKVLMSKIKEIEKKLKDTNIDIEFAVTKKNTPVFFQVRKISLEKRWKNNDRKIKNKFFILSSKILKKISNKKDSNYYNTVLTSMSDWNPAEMIGLHPSKLSYSIYSNLITNRVWSKARSEMGYFKVNHNLMENVFSQPFINTKLSFLSLIPNKLDKKIRDKLCNAWLQRLKTHPEHHDKIEFEIATTCYDFNFIKKFNKRYKKVLSIIEFQKYSTELKALTQNLLSIKKNSSLVNSIRKIKKLNLLLSNNKLNIANLVKICKTHGTLPFSIIARHAFIAESFLISLKENKCINDKRLIFFRGSLKTITSELINDTNNLARRKISLKLFLKNYGHLRPSTYDINSKSYKEQNLKNFIGEKNELKKIKSFKLNKNERVKINAIIKKNNFDFKSGDLIDYIGLSIRNREYAKFVFTKCINQIFEQIISISKLKKIKRNYLDLLPLNFYLKKNFHNDKKFNNLYLKNEAQKKLRNLNKFLKISYIIRSERDFHVVPIHRSRPNFVGSRIITGKPLYIRNINEIKNKDLKNYIICIDNADPGYDLIFTKKFKGLITKYGGMNSHMYIRCAEFNLTAIIGAGDGQFNKILKSSKINANPVTKKVLLY